MSKVVVRRSARTNMYVTRPKTQRFLILPELKQGQRWGFAGVVDHPFYKHGPLLQWSGPSGTVMINRQLFYAMMTNRLEK